MKKEFETPQVKEFVQSDMRRLQKRMVLFPAILKPKAAILTYRWYVCGIRKWSGLEFCTGEVRLDQKHEKIRVSPTMFQSEIRYTLVLPEGSMCKEN